MHRVALLKQDQQKTGAERWLAGLRWLFAGYVAATLLAAGAEALEFPVAARGILAAGALCFVVSLVCAGACLRCSKMARWYLLLVVVMIMIAVLSGQGTD